VKEKISFCVYCGSSQGSDPAFLEAAREMGGLLGRQGIGLVYGGGNNGLMGALADACLQAGGEVHGVIPRNLADMDFAHKAIQHLDIVQTMHQRKARMSELSWAFVAMAGGVGTLEELFEALAWSQLGLHSKPVGILNTKGYYDGLLKFLQHAQAEGFIPRADEWLVEREPAVLLESISAKIGGLK
jgi:uncharacterized protein (TIGR00730 family)